MASHDPEIARLACLIAINTRWGNPEAVERAKRAKHQARIRQLTAELTGLLNETTADAEASKASA